MTLNHCWRGAAILLLLSVLACGGALPEVGAVRSPDESTLEKSVKDQLDAGQAAVDRAMKGSDPVVAANAWGGLGQLYLAYRFADAADDALRNAEQLDPGVFTWPYLRGLNAQLRGDFAAAREAFALASARNPDYLPARARLVEVALASGDRGAAAEPLAALVGKPEFAAFHAAASARLQDGGPAGAALAAFPDPLAERVGQLAISAGSLLEQGRQALAAGDFERAEAIFRRGADANPDNTELRLDLALAQVRGGRNDEGLATLREVLAQDPDNARALHDLGAAYSARGLYLDAMAAFRKAIELKPDYPSAWFNLANAQVGLEQWQEAGPTLEQALRLTPDDTRLLYLQAMVHHRSGRSPQAIDQLRRLVEREPDDQVMREGLAGVLADAGRTVEALDVYRKVAAAPGKDAADSVRLFDAGAKLAWRKNLREQSIGLWRQAIELHPGSSVGWMNLANGLQLIGRRDEARADFAKAIELDPKNATAWLSEASLLILGGDFAVARQRLEAALAAVPDHAALMNTLARLLATCPDPAVRDGKRAFELAQKALALDNRLEHAETAAMAMAEMGQFEQAIRYQRSLVHQAQSRTDRQTLSRLMGTLRSFEQRRPIRAHT